MSTGWLWRLMAAVVVGMAAGSAAAVLVGMRSGALEAGVVCALTLAAGSKGPVASALPVAFVVGLVVVVYSTIGALTTGHPVPAALAMAVVAFTTSVMTAAKPVGLLIGMVSSYAYILVTGIGVIAADAIGHDIGRVGVLSLIGLVTGLVLVVLRAGIEHLLGSTPDTRPAPHSRPSLIAPMLQSLRSFDDAAKDGVRRAVALGIAMFAFQAVANHAAYWTMLTAFVVLQPSGRSRVHNALLRVAGTFAGVTAVAAISPLLPDPVAMATAVVALAVSIAASTRSATLAAALGSISAVLLTGVPDHDVIQFAGERLFATVVGAAIALIAGYLLWPRSGPRPDPVPDDLAATASEVGISAT